MSNSEIIIEYRYINLSESFPVSFVSIPMTYTFIEISILIFDIHIQIFIREFFTSSVIKKLYTTEKLTIIEILLQFFKQLSNILLIFIFTNF